MTVQSFFSLFLKLFVPVNAGGGINNCIGSLFCPLHNALDIVCLCVCEPLKIIRSQLAMLGKMWVEMGMGKEREDFPN